jgi:hypothetical protein
MIDELVRSLSAIEDADRHLGRVKLLRKSWPIASARRRVTASPSRSW